MLTYTTELYNKTFVFSVFGTPDFQTEVHKYLDEKLLDEKLSKKLIAILNAINTNPLLYSHEQKFKHLEDDVWEIKIKSLRIACVWDKKPELLIAIYAFNKKYDRWRSQDLKNMRNQKSKYFDTKVKVITGGYHGRINKI
jgi:hypothetical protein